MEVGEVAEILLTSHAEYGLKLEEVISHVNFGATVYLHGEYYERSVNLLRLAAKATETQSEMSPMAEVFDRKADLILQSHIVSSIE